MNRYQVLARETALYPGKDGFQGLCYCVFKLSGEAGEVSEKIGKLLRDKGVEWGTDPWNWSADVRESLKKELGDALWYIANLSRELGYNLQEIAEANLEKLESREERGVVHGSGDNR